jgi:toxin CcdB
MPQFAVYRNPNPATAGEYPLLVDVQSDLLSDLATRVVIPLCPASVLGGRLVRTLMPVVDVAGDAYALLTPQLAGIPRKQLGEAVGSLAASRGEITAALDLLISGI